MDYLEVVNNFSSINDLKFNSTNFLPSIQMKLLKNTKQNWEDIDNDPNLKDLFDVSLVK